MTLSESVGAHREKNSHRDNSRTSFIDDLTAFATEHHAQHWRGTFAEFLHDILPKDPTKFTRSSHQYIYDMLCWYRDAREPAEESPDIGPLPKPTEKELFAGELFGIDSALERVIDYFKAAAAGSDVGRRLLLLLGPPSGGKSTMVILLKRGLEEYSHTDDGALYALQGSPLHESPLNLIPASLRPRFRATYGVDVVGELSPYSRARLDDEFNGDFMRFPVERVFLSEAARVGVGTYAPHDPTTADIADLVGSVDLSKVADIGDEGDPRAWSWSGAVYAASRGVLEMIEILKVKREFLYLLLTLTQEKNVKVSRFPLIHLDETILAHTNLAEFNKFLQEKENEALLDRMVIVKVPYTLSYRDEARIYRKLVSSAPAFRKVHFDPHVLDLAAVFSILTRLQKPTREGLDLTKKLKLYANEDVEGFSAADVPRIHAESTDEGLTGVSPRFVINAISNAITRNNVASLTSMEMLLALKDAIETVARMDAARKKQWIEFLVLARKDFYNRWVKEDVHKALFVSFEQEAQDLLDKYLDEVEATLDNHSRLHEAIEQYLFEERRDVLRLVTSRARPDEDAEQKISAVQERLINEYGYDKHSAKEALNYVTTLLSQE
jgi:serine protein kinase